MCIRGEQEERGQERQEENGLRRGMSKQPEPTQTLAYTLLGQDFQADSRLAKKLTGAKPVVNENSFFLSPDKII